LRRIRGKLGIDSFDFSLVVLICECAFRGTFNTICPFKTFPLEAHIASLWGMSLTAPQKKDADSETLALRRRKVRQIPNTVTRALVSNCVHFVNSAA
jgi:hypothetical protein